MSRSKLEKYLSILEVLISNPQRFEDLSYKTEIECGTLKRLMVFLTSHKLVVEHPSDEGVVYTLTDRGIAVFRTLKAKEYFKRIRAILPVVDEAKEISQLLSKYNSETNEETESTQ